MKNSDKGWVCSEQGMGVGNGGGITVGVCSGVRGRRLEAGGWRRPGCDISTSVQLSVQRGPGPVTSPTRGYSEKLQTSDDDGPVTRMAAVLCYPYGVTITCVCDNTGSVYNCYPTNYKNKHQGHVGANSQSQVVRDLFA